MLSINTNIPSLIAQRSLNNSTKLLNQAIERMTTGFKINHASDNAANFSITTNMTTKIGAYEVAEENVMMGLDLLDTANGSLDLISDKLSRLRALAEQAANGTYGDQSLKAINSEANAIVDEIERIYSTAEYNGTKLFGITGGSFIEKVQQRDTSSMTKLSSIDPTTSLTSGTYSISTAEELAQLSTMSNTGKINANTEFVLANDIDLSAYSTGQGWTPIALSSSDLQDITFDGNGYIISNLYINRNNNCMGLFGHGYRSGKIKNLGIENANVAGFDNSAILIGADIPGVKVENCYAIGSFKAFPSASIEDPFLSFAKGDAVNSYYLSEMPQNSISIDFQVGINSTSSSCITLDTAFDLNVSSLRGIGMGNNYLDKIDTLINTVSDKQTEFGAAQNRLESAAEEISTQYENLVSSRSTLRDADVSKVSSEYIRQQILQQASATLLATANQSPALALQLL